MDFADLRGEVLPALDRTYLNTGTSGPTPRPAVARQTELLELLNSEGFASPPAMRAYMRALDDARRSLAGVLGAPAHTVALTHSTSEGIGIVAAGIDWKPGDEVITSDLEHVSGVVPWLHLAQEKGIRVVTVRSADGYIDAQTIAEAISERTRLICISHVAYTTGAVLPIAEVCRMAEEKGVWVVVDGAQGVGHVSVDVGAIGCHFYAMPGQKWLLGPEGTGALYVREDLIQAISPTRIGWASLPDESPGEFTHTVRSDARRFETGTVHAPAFWSLAASVHLLAQVGWEATFAHAQSLAEAARTALSDLSDLRILTPKHAPSGLLTFAVEDVDPSDLVSRLWSKHKVVVRSVPEPYGVRASFHAFNDQEDVARLHAAVRAEVKAIRTHS